MEKNNSLKLYDNVKYTNENKNKFTNLHEEGSHLCLLLRSFHPWFVEF